MHSAARAWRCFSVPGRVWVAIRISVLGVYLAADAWLATTTTAALVPEGEPPHELVLAGLMVVSLVAVTVMTAAMLGLRFLSPPGWLVPLFGPLAFFEFGGWMFATVGLVNCAVEAPMSSVAIAAGLSMVITTRAIGAVAPVLAGPFVRFERAAMAWPGTAVVAFVLPAVASGAWRLVLLSFLAILPWYFVARARGARILLWLVAVFAMNGAILLLRSGVGLFYPVHLLQAAVLSGGALGGTFFGLASRSGRPRP